jgi:BRI1 kinase inhibitor 1
MEKHIEVENQQQKSSPPSSQQHSLSSSPSHEFSFTISHNTFNTTFLNNNKSKFSPNSHAALDLSPADEIFFHGHLLPLQILSHFPSSISPRSSINSMDSFTLPIRELFSEEDENLPTKDSISSSNSSSSNNSSKNIENKNKNMESSKKVEGKFKFSFLSFSSTKGTKGCHKNKEDKEKNKKKLRFDFDVIHAMKKYLRMVKPLFKREKIRVHKKSYSYTSGNVTPRINKQEFMKGWNWKLGQYYSAPASMRTSPSNSGVLFPSTPLTPASDSTMEELQAAIQAAITHCKNSYSKEDKLNC